MAAQAFRNRDVPPRGQVRADQSATQSDYSRYSMNKESISSMLYRPFWVGLLLDFGLTPQQELFKRAVRAFSDEKVLRQQAYLL
jgi:hypothetical protein